MHSHTMYLEHHHRSRAELVREADAHRLARLARDPAPVLRRHRGRGLLARIRRPRVAVTALVVRPRSA